jgi:hypothetical protein
VGQEHSNVPKPICSFTDRVVWLELVDWSYANQKVGENQGSDQDKNDDSADRSRFAIRHVIPASMGVASDLLNHQIRGRARPIQRIQHFRDWQGRFSQPCDSAATFNRYPVPPLIAGPTPPRQTSNPQHSKKQHDEKIFFIPPNT